MFPRGIMMVWKDTGVGERWHPAPLIIVTEMDGPDPVIAIPCADIPKLVGPYRVAALRRSRRYRGCHEALLEDAGRWLVLNPRVPDAMAEEMAPDRARYWDAYASGP